MKLIVVESPTKARKIQDYLGEGFEVLPSAGHVRDLPPKDLGIDLDTFAAQYEVLEAKAPFLARIKSAAARAEHVFLATDPDREGEAIAWHISEQLRLRKFSRARFGEITPKAVTAALASAGPLNTALVNAQQTRRILDRVVGWKVSPLLRLLGSNHSAGRVQSAALHLVVEREKARERFTPEDYWTLGARYANGLKARYATLNEEGEVEDMRLSSEAEAKAIAARAQGAHVVKQVERKPSERRAPPPFTTMELQQAAGRKLRFSLAKTMELAQRLFEQGHITYHRTDSPGLSEDALAMVRAWLAKEFPAGLPSKPNTFKAKASAQEAHEAIRPTTLEVEVPEELTGEEAALYRMIRARFLACQCKPAVYDTTSILIESADTTWRARGAVLSFEGWKRYAEEAGLAAEEKATELPRVEVGEVLSLVGIDVEARQTKPPPRFTFHSLAKEMERTGIGRPSTYATIADEEGVLVRREYIAQDEKKSIYPTERGRAVDEVLSRAFGSLVEVDYTAQLEQKLDEVAEGTLTHTAELRTWWEDFSRQLAAAPAAIHATLEARPDLVPLSPDAPKPTGRNCPRCGKELLLRQGKQGPFLSCSGWSATPRCEYSADPSAKLSEKPCPRCGSALEETAGKHGPYVRCLAESCGYVGHPEAKAFDLPCPVCGGAMEETQGKKGPYARCLARDCGGTRDLSAEVEEPCPVCLKGPMRDKGEFLSCSSYPTCKGSWDKRALAKAKKLARKCPQCRVRLLREGKSARGPFLGCSGYPVCSYIAPKER